MSDRRKRYGKAYWELRVLTENREADIKSTWCKRHVDRPTTGELLLLALCKAQVATMEAIREVPTKPDPQDH